MSLPFKQSLCDTCQRFRDTYFDQKSNVYVNTCEAFPGGIPDDIFYDAADHTNPWKGDDGLRYVEKTE